MQSTHIANLPISHMSIAAHYVHILLEIKCSCLISVRKLCNYGFMVNFDNDNVFPRKEKLLLTGDRNPVIGLFLIYFYAHQMISSAVHPSVSDLTNPLPAPYKFTFSVYKTTTKNDLFIYLHRSACSLVLST